MENQAKLNKKAFAHEIWLNNINDYLLKNGHITQQEHQKMASKIMTFVSRMQPKRKI
jgi:hypothetical protein